MKILQDEPGVARVNGDPLVTSEVVVVAPFPLRATGTDANVQVRGVSPNVLTVRRNVKITQGRMFRPGLSELVVGRNATNSYSGLTSGTKCALAAGEWTVAGIFDAGGSAFDSEVWCDGRVLDDVYKRPNNIFQSATVHLASPDAFQGFKDAVSKDPRLDVDVSREVDYYAKQSQMMTRLITVLGGLVAAVMGIGAVFGALNTMYSAVSERGREIAVMRALGFGAIAVVFSFLLEALLISFVGGAVGCAGGFAAQRLHDRHHELADLLQHGIRLQDYARPALGWNYLRSGNGRDGRLAPGNPRRTSAHLRGASLLVTGRRLPDTGWHSEFIICESDSPVGRHISSFALPPILPDD